MATTLAFSLDRARDEALFLQLARAVADEIASGRLRRGEALPSTRALALELGVHRNTVVAAYAELVAEGWVSAKRGDATRVVGDVPRPVRVRARRPRAARSEEPAYALGTGGPGLEVVPKARYAMLGGVPELRGLDVTALARAYRRSLSSRGRETLRYAGPEGDPKLRAALAHWLRGERGLTIGADDLLVTRGSQMALYLAAQVLLSPGDAVAVEALGYTPAWDAFRARGAVLLPVPLDAQGLDVDALARLCAKRRIRALYITPHHQYPTTVTLSPARRLALLALAHRERFAIVEDDYDHAFRYEGRPVLPLASRDAHGSVLYVGTFAKILAPALRIGFVVAPRAVLARMHAARFVLDRQGDNV